MPDRTLPFYNIILRCDQYEPQPAKLPEGHAIMPYRPGFEREWARLTCAVGDFSTAEEATRYFTEKYPGRGNDGDILFLHGLEG